MIQWKFIRGHEVLDSKGLSHECCHAALKSFNPMQEQTYTEIVSLAYKINYSYTFTGLNMHAPHLQYVNLHTQSLSHMNRLAHTHTHIFGYHGVPLQLPVDELPLVVATRPLAGFKPGRVLHWPQRDQLAINDDCCPVLSPALCKKKPANDLPTSHPGTKSQHPTGPRLAPATQPRAPVACI